MTNPADRVEIITSVQRRRRWTASEKVRIVEETFEPGMTVSLVARRHGVAPNQLFTWRRLVVEGALRAAGSGRTGGAGVGLSGFAEAGARAATAARQEDAGSRDPQGSARTRHGVKKTAAAAAVAAEGRFAMKAVAEVIGVSRSNLIERMCERAKKRIGRPPLPDDKLVAEIKAVIVELPTYGYRRVHAILKRQALAAGLKPPNHKPGYRGEEVHDLLLDRPARGTPRR